PINLPINGVTLTPIPGSLRTSWVAPGYFNKSFRSVGPGDSHSHEVCWSDLTCGGLTCHDGRCECGAAHPCPWGFSCADGGRCIYDEVACETDYDCVNTPGVGREDAECGDSGTCVR